MTLLGHFIFYDFEASGLDAHRAEPLEIAALRVEDGCIIERFSTLIRPRDPVDRRIFELTGIDPAQLAQAETPELVAPKVSTFMGDLPRVSHNARYDETLLRRLLNTPARGAALDSLELSHFLRPDLRSHALQALCRTLEIPQPKAHRADADAEAMLAVVLELLRDAASRPRQLKTIISAVGDSPWPWQRVVADVLAEAKSVGQQDPEPRCPEKIDDGELKAVDLFLASADQQHALARVVPEFEPRPQQLDMAAAIETALEDKQHALIEAPTGVGKSLAYLAPAALFARRTGLPVLISTNTKGLQDQLRARDLRTLAESLSGRLRWQVVKGRTNYVCMVRWRDTLHTMAADAPMDERLALAYLGAIATGPTDGELDDLHPFMRRRLPTLGAMAERLRGQDCNGQQGHKACPTGRVAQNASRAHLIVVNHAMLMSGSQLLPPYQHAIIDEAHALEDRALSVLSTVISGRELGRMVKRLGTNADTRGLARALSRSAGAHKGVKATHEAEQIAWAGRSLLQAHKALGELAQETIFERAASLDTTPNGYQHDSQEFAIHELPPEHRRGLQHKLDDLGEALRNARQALDDALRWIGHHGALNARRRVLERRLADAKFEVFEYLETLESFGEEPERAEVRVLQQQRNDRDQWIVRADPLCAAKELHERLFEGLDTAILTSATLSLNDNGAFLSGRVGYPDPEKQEDRASPLLKLDSPWELTEAAVNLVVEDLPPVLAAEQRARAMAKVVCDVAGPMGGRTLVLFSSAARLRRTAELVRPQLRALNLELLEQYRDGSVDHLLRRMRWDENTVLFGVSSFWTGVDIAGPALSCVIIERIPFASQMRPVVAARMAEESSGYRGFQRYLLPAALLDLRQGAGRLLRRGTDRGLIVLCHEELSEKRYAPAALEMLPGETIRQVRAAELNDAVLQAASELGIEIRGSRG